MFNNHFYRGENPLFMFVYFHGFIYICFPYGWFQATNVMLLNKVLRRDANNLLLWTSMSQLQHTTVKDSNISQERNYNFVKSI